MKIPVAPRHPHNITQHGLSRCDDYFWMRFREDPAVMDYLLAENTYLESSLAHTAPLQVRLFEEMKFRIKETDSSVPEKYGDYSYYVRSETGKQYSIYCRKLGENGQEEILLDQNTLSDDKDFCRLGAFAISPDQKKLAYSIDEDGSELCRLYIRNLETGMLYPELFPATFGDVYDQTGLAWAADSETLFYIRLDAVMRPDRLFCHRLGTDPANDVLVFHEKDESYSLNIRKTNSEEYLLITLRSHNGSETWYMAASTPETVFSLLEPRQPKVDYFVEHHNTEFFILTNENALNFKLMSTPVATPDKSHWQEIIPHDADVMIEKMLLFSEYLVLFERKNGASRIRISTFDQINNPRYINIPETAYYLNSGGNLEYDTHVLRFIYSSPVTPQTCVDYDIPNGGWHTRKVDEILGGYERERFTCERVFVPGQDGAKIPLTLVHLKDLKKDGSNPALLYGYGAYGYCSEASFNPNVFSLVERGFVYGIAHIRGGSDMGRNWYEQGRLLNKKNSFTDLIDCAEYLIKEGFTVPQHLSIRGASAGGLLVGACATMRPDLFRAVIAEVPFMDVINSTSDPTLPLTVIEYGEWGNPQDKTFFEYMFSYSPYDNICPTAYPAMLVTSGMNDPRVAFWEPAKFVARLRATKTDENLLLLKTNLSAGHAGASGRYDHLKEIALEYAFLIEQLGGN